jgi:hypothetical protein
VTDADFAVRAPPAIPKSTGAFNEFTYVLDPFESREEYEKEQQRTAAARAHVMQGPMKAGGRVQRNEQLKAQVVECMRRLSKALAADWPKAFLRTFEDKQGLLVTAFDRQVRGDSEREPSALCPRVCLPKAALAGAFTGLSDTGDGRGRSGTS